VWNTWLLRGEGARTRVGCLFPVPHHRIETRRSDPGTWDRANDEMPAPSSHISLFLCLRSLGLASAITTEDGAQQPPCSCWTSYSGLHAMDSRAVPVCGRLPRKGVCMHLRAGHASFLGSTVGRQPHREIGGTDCAAGHGYCRARGIIARSRLFLGNLEGHANPVAG
jgi:hypothetical protein